MRYSFRLAELLGHIPDPRKRPGTIKAIVEHTGLDRHQVASLLKNEVKYIPLKALSRLCDYLIDNGYASADELPGALFAVEPENFWELLARRQRLELCLGVRRDVEVETPEVSYLVASDSVLLGELLNGVTTLGGTAKHMSRAESESEDQIAKDSPRPHPEFLKQSLVWSPGQLTPEEVRERAHYVYDEFAEAAGDKALVCIGSMKSNPVVELVLANAFGCEPFESQDTFAHARDRSLPFFLRYRDRDPKPSSCAAGTQIGKDVAAKEPGIYYEEPDGSWSVCPLRDGKEDTALVFYVYRESQGRLEMTMAGFTGRATRMLARALSSRAEDFWPPVYEGQGIQIGAYVVQFTFDHRSATATNILDTDLSASTKVIPLDGSVFERRIGVVPT